MVNFQNRNGDDYDAAVPIEFNSVDSFDNGESINVELSERQIVKSPTDTH